MSLCDLRKRTTEDWTEYNKYKKSSDSLLYVNGGIHLNDSGPITLNITAGDCWFMNGNQKLKIPTNGLKIKSNESVLIETEQEFALPHNLFGIIYGTGKNIFLNGFISSGKINPTYHGRLKIGYFNGSRKPIIFKRGDLLACCSFFDCETTLPIERPSFDEPQPMLETGIWNALKYWFSANWHSVISSLIAISAILVSILKSK